MEPPQGEAASTDRRWEPRRQGRQHLPHQDIPNHVRLQTAAALRFDLIGQAYERQSLVVTTNLPFENWTGDKKVSRTFIDHLR